MLCKKAAFKSFAKLIGKHWCQKFFLNKVADLSLQLYKKTLWHRCFPDNHAKYFKDIFFYKSHLVAASLFTLRLLHHRYHHYNTIKFNESLLQCSPSFKHFPVFSKKCCKLAHFMPLVSFYAL